MSQIESDEVLRRLTQVFHRVFGDDTIVLTSETTAADIPQWDSLNQVKIILGCEREFAIKLRPREINALENVAEMVEHLQRALSKQSKSS